MTSSITCAGVMRGERLPGRLIAAVGDVVSEPRPVGILEPRRKHRPIGGDIRLGLRQTIGTGRIASAQPAEPYPASLSSSGPTNASSSWPIGAISHAHRHSTSVSVTSWPGVVSPGPIFSRSLIRSSTCSAPRRRQGRLVQTRSSRAARRARAEHVVERDHLADVRAGHAHVPPDPVFRLLRDDSLDCC